MLTLSSRASKEPLREMAILGCGSWKMEDTLIRESLSPWELTRDMEAEEEWEERGQETLCTVQLNLFLVLHGIIVYI